ncbi:hypothetical protein NG697_05300 [Pseudarthrobacter sp. MDT3-26]|uniref:hypothetical protein n=1 Tax=Pseudarthrobacter raffinosi TaxID=2953651 RepID=UPI00208F734E|nr:hypothetical protein [Pseudarthrobacter sp. MDT3-26]MCO4262347.1 hypothetical protein [Pseudarthrobacter sp. MDT3-26]
MPPNIVPIVATLSSADVTVKTTTSLAENAGWRTSGGGLLVDSDAAGFAAHREYEHIERIGAAQIISRLERRTIQTFEVTADA